MVGPIKVRYLAKNQHTSKEKNIYKIPTMNVSSSKIGHNFRKQSGSNIEGGGM